MKKWWMALVCAALIGCCGGAMAEYSPGFLMQPPGEVLDHIARSFPQYTLEDYCEVYDTPKGDYGFAMLTAGDERLLVGYEEKNGKMSYWLKNHGAVPQGSEEAWFFVSEKGKAYINSRTDQMETSDGLSFGVTRLDDAGESYEKAVSYHWEDGGFKLSSYKHDTAIGVYIEDGYLEFWDWGWWRKDGAVKGVVQTDIRYVNYNTLPATIEEARAELSEAPYIPEVHGVRERFALKTKKIKFTGGRNYPVYNGPGERYVRAGNGKASVSTNDWIQVFGEYDGWILIQYDISSDHYRFGWIKADALPRNAQVDSLNFHWDPQEIGDDCVLTDDPMQSGAPLCQIDAQTPVYALAWLGETWEYICVEIDGKTWWGFVPTDMLTHG